jgi:hypothetical protein
VMSVAAMARGVWWWLVIIPWGGTTWPDSIYINVVYIWHRTSNNPRTTANISSPYLFFDELWQPQIDKRQVRVDTHARVRIHTHIFRIFSCELFRKLLLWSVT